MLFTLSYAQHLVVEHNTLATIARHFMYRAIEHLSNGPMIDHILNMKITNTRKLDFKS